MSNWNAEQFFKPILRGPMTTNAASDTNQWAGRTSITTAAATATVSTTLVNSDSIITYGLELKTNQASGTRIGLKINTISPGNFFTFGTDDGIKLVTNGTVHWIMTLTS